MNNTVDQLMVLLHSKDNSSAYRALKELQTQSENSNKVYAYIAGKLIGGMDARSPVEGIGIDRMADAITLQNVEIEKLGDDFCIVGYVK